MSESITRILKLEEGDEGKQSKIEWDLYSQQLAETEVHIRGNEIENIRSPVLAQGFAVRVIRERDENSSGVGISPGLSILDEADLRRSVMFALEGSKLTSFPRYTLPSSDAGRKGMQGVKISDSEIIGEDKESLAKEIGEEVLSLLDKEKDIKLTFGKIRFSEISTKLQNVHGLDLSKSETFCYFEAGLTPKEGPLAEYWPRFLGRCIRDLELEANIPKWAKFARDSPLTRQPETGRYDIIVSPEVLTEIIPPIVAFHASASSLRKNMSKFQKRGQKVWDEKITIVDDGLVDYGTGTSPFDDEGTPQTKTVVLKDGRFNEYISNRMYSRFVPRSTVQGRSYEEGKKTAVKDDGNSSIGECESTGNALKAGRPSGALCYSDNVGMGHTNVVMHGGDSSSEEIIEETSRGLLIEQFSWMLPDSMTGSFGAEIRHAYLVERGEVREPIKGGVVYGSLFDSSEGTSSTESEPGVLRRVDLISKETQLVSSAVLPWIRFSNLRVSGR